MILIYCLFCVTVVISNIFSAKLIPLPFFEGALLPAGVLIYPFTFFLSDLVTEFYGKEASKKMVYMAFGVTLFGLILVQLLLYLPGSHSEAFRAVFGLNKWAFLASMAAYLVGHMSDIRIYSLIKKWTGDRFLGLRNNLSMLLSQAIDTWIVDTLYLFGALAIPYSIVLKIMLISYVYKSCFSLATTPFFYGAVWLMRRRRAGKGEKRPVSINS